MGFTYVEGYGWHCDRRLLWPLLMAGSAASWFVTVPLEWIAQSTFHFRVPVVLLVAAIPVLVLSFKVCRKLRGEPLFFDPPLPIRRLNTALLIRRTESPRIFWSLLFIDSLIWLSASFVLVVPLFDSGLFAAHPPR